MVKIRLYWVNKKNNTKKAFLKILNIYYFSKVCLKILNIKKVHRDNS